MSPSTLLALYHAFGKQERGGGRGSTLAPIIKREERSRFPKHFPLELGAPPGVPLDAADPDVLGMQGGNRTSQHPSTSGTLG